MSLSYYAKMLCKIEKSQFSQEGLYEYLSALPFWIANDMVKKLAYFFPHVNSIQTYTLFPRPVAFIFSIEKIKV